MAVGQTEPLPESSGKWRGVGHFLIWGGIPAVTASLMREYGAGPPAWYWLVAGGVAQGGITVARELWERRQNKQTGGKMKWDLLSKLGATAVSWATFDWWWR
jgi:hypothetical protein